MPDVDSQLQDILERYARYKVPPIASLTPQAARNAPTLKNAVEELAGENVSKRLVNLAKPMPMPVGEVTHITIPSPNGPLLARVFTPAGDGPFPGVVYFHGGGWVIADLNVYEPGCRAMCDGAACVVVSVAYRQAPEAPFPAAVEDALTAWEWVSSHAATLKIKADCLAIAGESAGGNLATVTAMQVRDKGGKAPIFQLLVYPVTSTRLDWPSMNENGAQPPLLKEMMPWFLKHYAPNTADHRNPLLAPELGNLAGLPPALVITAELDVLRDQGEAYVQKLKAAGVPAHGYRYTGMTHEFFGLAGVVDEATSAMARACEYLKEAFDAAKEGRAMSEEFWNVDAE